MISGCDHPHIKRQMGEYTTLHIICRQYHLCNPQLLVLNSKLPGNAKHSNSETQKGAPSRVAILENCAPSEYPLPIKTTNFKPGPRSTKKDALNTLMVRSRSS